MKINLCGYTYRVYILFHNFHFLDIRNGVKVIELKKLI